MSTVYHGAPWSNWWRTEDRRLMRRPLCWCPDQERADTALVSVICYAVATVGWGRNASLGNRRTVPLLAEMRGYFRNCTLAFKTEITSKANAQGQLEIKASKLGSA